MRGDEVTKVEVEHEEYKTTNGMLVAKTVNSQSSSSTTDNPNLMTVSALDGHREMADPVEVMKCEGEFTTEVVSGTETLFYRIHKGDGVAATKRREVERRIVAGMVQMVEKKKNLEAGSRISPHRILLSKTDTVFIRVQTEQENQQSQPLPPPTAISGWTGAAEEVRWRAPAQGEKEDEMNSEVSESKATVFRFGLILFEVETGLVPFAENDAVTAHRNLAAGMSLPIDRIADETLRELIVECLSVDPDQRPTLQNILVKLEQ
ncbi:hypothetical protein BLNAU_951 [Blattamonas nauphoetae]|uniref:Protein kinase domain-containing protein n=1 Tax=Blattamonas nauphoetae TaxID=2049346 RepID=A0ABQ9YJX0_9EUKA|nr:hypothetical protein BLNAU_951 [Blattamonas nauphoetae]